jgi:hypothetical protein
VPHRGVRWLVVLALLTPTLTLAQSSVCPIQGKGLEPVGFASVTVSTVAVGFDPTTLDTTSAAAAYMTIEGTAPVRFVTFGTPTAASGHLVDPPGGGNAGSGAGVWICGRAALLGFRAIRSGAADATVRVSLFRQR